ncbi:hypothetical protein [uncultured Clostridium sp.]|uniref:hypothetical protein n=1 Tax=uncultured Clostridium sp. TaxID=59620 RepID=UPI00263B0D0E|nr:hypothetical protein [uncultured Clostridium sp.]
MINKIIKLINNDYKNNINFFNNAHKETPYIYNGNSVPRVTEILSSMLHEEYIVGWSNYLGFRRTNYRDAVEEAAAKGTFTHNFIENKLKYNKDPLMDMIPLEIKYDVEKAYNSFLYWWESIQNHDIYILMQEMPLICPYFGGTLDLLMDIDNIKYLIDFKTSNHVSYKYYLQLSAYKYILSTIYGIEVDKLMIVQFSKKEIAYTEYILDCKEDKEYIDLCTNTFFSLLNAYYERLKCEILFDQYGYKFIKGDENNDSKECIN